MLTILFGSHQKEVDYQEGVVYFDPVGNPEDILEETQEQRLVKDTPPGFVEVQIN
jgi:hypothetical protein